MDVGLIDAPGFVRVFEVTAEPLVQFWAVALHPALDGGMVRLQTALYQQFLDIA